ncbi:OpgC family protein [Pseudovibrio ascidiaceicola]|uniref:OpgC family protein n=1 Tax=Pseudovibrio ascidiaceicola TaxID=285279 RepID=UPI003D35EEE4
MFIIFIAHLPANGWALWIPARFGFSDATEIFVFCSGMASAIAFGRVFELHGLVMGSARVLYRVWQVYWAHICLFLAVAGMLAFLQINGWTSDDYVGKLNLWHFFEDPIFQLPGLLTLTYVPNYFDILPMYLVILAMLPVIMIADYKAGRGAVAALIIAFWLIATFRLVDFPAEPWSDRRWFFNPFAWQLLFFTGFAFIKGWLPAPPVKKRLLFLSASIIILTIPFAYFRILNEVPELRRIANDISDLTVKSEMGLLRYIHFLALAYVAWVAVGEGGQRLLMGGFGGKIVRVIKKVGQQSLAVFLASLILAQGIAIFRDELGLKGTVTGGVMANLLGFAGLIAVAYTVAWFKGEPWRKAKEKPAS